MYERNKTEFMKKLEKRMQEQHQIKSEKSETPKSNLNSNNQFMGKLIAYLFAAVFGFFIIAGALAFGAFAWGYIFYSFWGWFVLPVFTTLPVVNIYQAIGLVMFLDLFKNMNMPVMKEEYRDSTTQSVMTIIAPFVVFIVGWLVHYFIVMPYAG